MIETQYKNLFFKKIKIIINISYYYYYYEHYNFWGKQTIERYNYKMCMLIFDNNIQLLDVLQSAVRGFIVNC